MKRVISIILFVLILLVAAVYAVESTGALGISKFRPHLQADYSGNAYTLTWTRMPYPAYYEVEVLKSPPPGNSSPASPAERVAVYHTWQNQMTFSRIYPFRTYWRVSAHGLFREPLGRYSNYLNLAKVLGISAENFHRLKPAATCQYPESSPASDKPMLTWTVVPGAVYYEIEFLDAPPENPNATEPSEHRVAVSREVFTNGYNADLSNYLRNVIFWRVRALDYDGNPLGVFSDAQETYIDHTKQTTLKPLVSVDFNRNGMATPLYPAYSWVPILGAVKYEVELLNSPPENPNGTTPSKHRIWSTQVTGFDCYDEEPRGNPGTYYWRVIGLDASGEPVGTYSDAGKFVVDLSKGTYAATFGDSITHGGGAVSYSPADWEYSFQTYLSFPNVNLGKSGDTSETMVERFERDVLPFRPKYLIIMGGTNSLRGGVPASKVIEELTIIRDKCLANDIRPIFMTLPPINPSAIWKVFQEDTAPKWRQEFETVNAFIRKQPYYVDLAPYFVDTNNELPDYYAIDGLHPDIPGKKLMGQLINANWTNLTRE